MNRGIYLAILHLPKTQSITIGRFGRFTFSAGDYLYVGSARRNLLARFARHSRRRKTRRWHIDYLSVRADFLGAAHRCSQEHGVQDGGGGGETVCVGSAEIRGIGLPVRRAPVLREGESRAQQA